MRYRQANHLPVDRVYVGQVALHSARMRDREFSVHRRIEVLLGEQAPVRDDAVVPLARQLGAPGPIIESLIATEEQC